MGGGGRMKVIPITLREANTFVDEHHRHHKATQGCKFALGLLNGETLCGVAICGRPVSRYLDNGLTLEITRLCTDGTPNACSKLYSSCVKVARAMGYEKVVTYILQSENGSSLKASNFVCEGKAGEPIWTGKRNRDNGGRQEMKQRYVCYITGTGKENIFREGY